jgi:MoaA/NifB/PqqE/SkfB family radical SAM enzyme
MAAYKFSDIRKVHLEISSKCNAACPRCPRNTFGYPFNNGYIEHDMTVDEAKKIFTTDFLIQLDHIMVNGNFGDAIVNQHTIPILTYFKESNPSITLDIITNGSARNTEFWKQLANLGVEVHFSIDGLLDTNHLYRQNTNFDKIIENAKAFIDAGGTANWKWVKFKHNEHQIEEARQLANDLGFTNFYTVWDGRDVGPVFDRHGEMVYYIDNGRNDFHLDANTPVNNIIQSFNHKVDFRSIDYTTKDIDCEVMHDSSIYVSSTGNVYPCCYLGFEPKTYGKGTFMQVVNNQISEIMYENNALEYDLEHCIQWFRNVTNSWNISTCEGGKLLQCNETCGIKK